MASQVSSRSRSSWIDKCLRRTRLRRALLESLERRELLAADMLHYDPVFAPGTPTEYMQQVLEQFHTGGDGQHWDAVNLQGSRWTDPVGGPSPNMGDPAVITWSIAPDGTIADADNNTPSNLIAFMDSIYGGGSGPLQNRPWFGIFERAYQRWSQVTGLQFVYEPNDDGVPIGGSNRGVAGVRGDVRIAGRPVDGNFGVLAFNYYPMGGGNAGYDGDMIIDTNDVWYFQVADGPTGENRGLNNVLMHEAGHGIGLGHVIPVDQTKLMEPTISLAFLGAQHDDILGGQQLYGDPAEPNDSQGAATDLGTLGNGLKRVTGNSLDADNDTDWYKFSVISSAKLSVTLESFGLSYDVGPQDGSVATVDTQRNQDLSFKVFDASGNELADVSAASIGNPEALVDLDLPAAGDYFLRIDGSGSDPQMYNLLITLKGIVDPNAIATPPRLLAVAPNVGEIFSFNRTNELTVAPNELTFRFDGSQSIDPATFSGIRVTRAGKDGSFTDGDEVVITPGWIGFGESDRVVIMRFAETLPDDLYRIEVFAEDDPDQGITAVRNIKGETLKPRFPGTDRDTLLFDLELGAQVIAVVPQPVTVQPGGTLVQAREQIEVYFNDDDLHHTAVTTTGSSADPTVVKPEFYQLILTRDTVHPGDDEVFLPTSVSYDPALDRAVLTFDQPIDQLAGGVGTFRLRVGSNVPVNSATNPPVIPTIAPAADPAGFLNGAFDLSANGFTISSGSSAVSALVAESLINVSNSLLLDYPGSNYEPGHRDIQDQNHLGGFEDDSQLITQAYYTFLLDQPYGVDAFGQPLYTSITPEQMDRVREIFEFYGAQLGIDFIESESQGMKVVVGDPFPNGVVSEPGGVLGVASVDSLNGLAIMDGAENWFNELTLQSFGGGQFSFFYVALHEIGHMLGLGHTYELPDGTIMGSTTALSASGSVLEEIFPGDHDVVHGQHGYRPDNKDVDLYKFDVPAGVKGTVAIETIAERLANSSLADTHLTLMKQTASGLEIVATNNDYFSSDSLIRAQLDEGTYYVAVTTLGNEDFDPRITNTGSGGVSQGEYQLRIDFVPEETTTIVDVSGTPLDGDGDGVAGGNFNFWFRAAAPIDVAAPGAAKTVYVNKDFQGTSTGAATSPFNSIPAAMAAVAPGDIVRITGSLGADGDVATVADNRAYEIGRGGVGNQVLADGIRFEVPRGVTAMIDAGAIFKMGGSRFVVGSRAAGLDNSFAALQVLGTPQQSVLFTSYKDESVGIDTNPLPTSPNPGDWGGIEFRNDVDRREGRGGYERLGIFLNYVGNADMRYGGGQITVQTPSPTINPIHLTESRPTLLHNRITMSADSAISADPNSFEETTFTEPRYQRFGTFRSDYERVGPDIRGNTLLNNSTNGLFIRVETAAGSVIDTLDFPGRFDDTDITHVLGENLIIRGTPGGPMLETRRPAVDLVSFSPASGALTPGESYNYRITFFDLYGAEGIPSNATLDVTVGSGGGVRLDNLPVATGEFVGRRIYRSANGGAAPYTLVAEIDKSSTSFIDRGQNLGVTLADPTATALRRARTDARLAIDPGIIVKSFGARIEAGISSQLIVEGNAQQQVVLTSRKDDRYGAGGTFDTNNDGTASTPAPGDWGGLLARHFTSLSVDHALITYGGGVTSVPGGFAGFNAIEVHQSRARIANSTIENNASGKGGNQDSLRVGRGSHDASVIFVRGSQPIIVNNIIQNNSATGTAVISIDANSLKAVPLQDWGRETGRSDRMAGGTGNHGPLVRENKLALNGLNGMRVRGATLTTESVWDDTDIVHILESEIVVPDFHTYGGLRLQSSANESLVVKLGNGAGITASGLPLDIPDRIGGSLQILGTPGFPVFMTSLRDDSVGTGFRPDGLPQLDTNGDGSSVAQPGDWRGIRLNPESNDRNVDTTIELEPEAIQDVGTNDDTLSAQPLGALANDMRAGDENLRLGFTVHGTIASPGDLDVYSFQATAGTTVWFDIDRTDMGLDTVIELIDEAGNIIAQSDNSLNESQTGAVAFVDPAAIPTQNVNVLERDTHAPRNTWLPGTAAPVAKDFQSINPLDAGLRVVLPGVQGNPSKYFVRVRSSNLQPGDPATNLQDPSRLRDGLSAGAYRMQIRMQQTDEIGGSTIRYADVRYAMAGIEVIGLPRHSPLLGTGSELSGPPLFDPADTVYVGNIAASDRAGVSVAGELAGAANVDWYRFTVSHPNLQQGDPHVSVSFDIDYADAYGRPNTTLWVFRFNPNDPSTETDDEFQLVLVGTDSDISDDRPRPGQNLGDVDDFSRGSFGTKDPFIGAQELLPGEYLVAVTNNSLVAHELRQYMEANPAEPLVRLEPIDSVQRIVVDRFDNATYAETANGPKQVAFSGSTLATTNAVPFTLADVSTYVVRNQGNGSRLLLANAFTGAIEAEVGSDFARVHDLAMSPDGRLVGYEINTQGFDTDANNGNFLLIDHAGNVGTSSAGNSGLQTFTTEIDNNGNFQVRQRTKNNAQVGDGMQFEGLTFYSNAAEVDSGNLRLFGVAHRGENRIFHEAFLDANNNPVGRQLISNRPVWGTNYVYRLNPTDGSVINPAGVQDRQGNFRTQGAGTQDVEFFELITADPLATVTGLAATPTRLYAVSDDGELFEMNVGDGTQPLGSRFQFPIATIVDPETTLPVAFTGLTIGPKNLEGGRFSQILFGTTTDGTIYAFDTAGNLQPVFPGANYKVKSNVAALGSGIQGVDFSPLDVNLWHLTDTRGGDSGHGRPATHNNARPQNQNGENSLYFGFENANNDNTAFRQLGDWDPIHAVYDNSYNLPGGAHGAIESLPIDLSDYSIDDVPMLYFNYYLETQGQNSDLTDNQRMLDAFRVYAAGEDGQWVLLSTNNSAINGNFTNGQDEFDVNISGNVDANGRPLMVQEAFDVGDNGAPDSWRQVRASLAAFAGQENVKLRFEFSTGGTFRSADPLRGGVELKVVPGWKLDDGATFSVASVDQPLAQNATFEFDLGLVLNLPGGASIDEGDSLTVAGVTYTFSQSSNVGTNIFYSPTDSPEQIANRVRLKLPFTSVVNPQRRNIINVDAPSGLPYSQTGLPPATIQGIPGVAAGNVRVPITHADSAAAVRDAVRQALAATFNAAGQQTNLDVWPVYGETVRLLKYQVTNAGPLVVANRLPGDQFGADVRNTALNNADERGQDNAFEGLFIDDILIGLAERGEAVVNNPPITTPNLVNNAGFFTNNLQYEPSGWGIDEIEVGRYQLEIRTAADYGFTVNDDELLLARTFDSNDRLTRSIGISVDNAAAIPDAATFTLSDGMREVTFEFDVINGPNDPAQGTQPGTVPISIFASDRASEVAAKIRDAINSNVVQLNLSVSASVWSNGSTVELHGPAAFNRLGSTQLNSVPGLSAVVWGNDFTPFGEDHGDENRLRDQGMVVISSTAVRNSGSWGIVVDAAPRSGAGAPSPGSPVYYPTNNANQLAPGVVLINNVLDENSTGGILISGDAVNPSPAHGQDVMRPSTIARVVNNTIYGGGSGTGIRVEQGASPNIINNILANNSVGIDVGGAQSTFALGANFYHANNTNVTPGGAPESFRLTSASDPFVNASASIFYLVDGSPAIDSSLEALAEHASLTQVKSSLALPPSPALAPDLDIVGQRRVDDPTVNTPPGLGANVFKDRGAYDRADFFGPVAVLLQPIDNDAENVDRDRTVTNIRLESGNLAFFSLLLEESGGGTGPNAATVTADSVTLTENGRLLQPGIDYVFGYNANSRNIRLTPLSGLWRPDSVYEITLNNQQAMRIIAPDGVSVADGDQFSVTIGGTTHTFEFDSDQSASAGTVAVPFSQTYSRYQMAAAMMASINAAFGGQPAYLLGDLAVMVNGATSIDAGTPALFTATAIPAIQDIAGNTLLANRPTSLTQFTILMPEVQVDYGDAPGTGSLTMQSQNGARHTLLPIDAPQLFLGAFADGDPDGVHSPAARGDDNESAWLGSTISNITIGTRGPASLQVPAPGVLDGQQITITDAILKTVIFEFDTDASVSSGAVIPVDLSAAISAADVASALAASINAAVLAGDITDLSAFAAGATVNLGGTRDHYIDLSAAPGVVRLPIGTFDLVFPTETAFSYADGQTLTLRDGQGQVVVFELSDPTVDAAVGVANVPVTVSDLGTATAEEIVQAFADAINARVTGGLLSLGPALTDGRTLTIQGDDEDGVRFGGIFNAASPAVPVTVTATAPGILDAWFDWNADGDFNDSGERIVANMPIQAGETTIMVSTPASAAIGFTTSRFRLSTNGNLDLTGIGIGGEVEDHLIEIVAGLPPVAVDDAYSVLEDSVLTVSAPGVLANDTDSDSASISVRDEDPFTAGIQPVKAPEHGTLDLQSDGSFVYTPDFDFFGTDSFVYYAIDNRLKSAVPATVVITVEPVNDSPTAIDDEITILEDETIVRPGSDFTANDFKGIFGNPSQINELGQTLTVINAVILGPAAAVSGGSVSVVNDTLTFTPPAHYNSHIDGPVLIELTIQDGGVAGGDANPLTDTSTLTIHITEVNDAPQFTMPSELDMTLAPTIVEDAGLVTVNNFLTDIRPGPVEATDEGTGPALIFEDQQVSFQVTALDPSQFVTLPSITGTTDPLGAGHLTFELVPQLNRVTPFAPILVEVVAVDTGLDGTPKGDVNKSAPVTFTILPAAINDAPEFDIPDTVTALEDQGVVTVGGFLTGLRPGPVEALDEAVQNLTVTIAADPASFTATGYPSIDLISGDLVYETAPHANRNTGHNFVVEVTITDDGGTALGGVDRTTKTFTIDVAELNDPPEYDMPLTHTSDEDAGLVTVPGFVSNILPGPAAATDEATGPVAPGENQIVTFTVTALDPSQFVTLPTITGTDDASPGTLTYELVPHLNQAAPFTPILVEVIAVDSGANDGGTSVPRNINSAAPRTFTILPTPINDAPEFTIPDTIDLLEDPGPQSIVDFVTDARPGPTSADDELAAQTLSILVTPLDPTAFTATGQPAIVLDQVTGRGTLTFELAPDVNNATGHDLRVEVALMDDGGVVHPLDVDTTVKTFTLSITPVNDAPSFDIPVPEVTVFEDQEQVTGINPTVIPGFATNIVAGPVTAIDETTLPATKQNLTFVTVSVSDPSLFSVQPTITPSGDLTFVTAADQNGQAIVVVHLLDDGPDSSTGNGDENQSRPDQTFTINLTPVNDPPEFTVPATVAGIEDQGLTTIPNFATGLRPGPLTATDETGQTFTVHVRAVDPSKFTVQPQIAADGTLIYQTGPDVNDLNADLRVIVYLEDDGVAGPLPDNNTSPEQTFTILATPVNDPPSFSIPNPSVTVIEDVEEFLGVSQTSIVGFAANAVPGPATATDEATQNLSFDIVSVSNPQLFDVQPTIDASGTLTFKTAQHKNGTTLVVVRLLDDGASSPPPNSNTTDLRTFTITLTPINDAPVFDVPNSVTVNEDAGLQNVGGFATNVRRGPVGTDDENNQFVQFEVVAMDPAVFVVQPSIAADGTLTFQTAPNVNSLNADLRVRVRLRDSGLDSPPPNKNVSEERTFTINVTPVNDPPVADAFTQVISEDAPVTINASDVLVGDVPGPTSDELSQSLSITQIERTSRQGGTIVPVFMGTEIVSFTYTPPANFVGSDSFVYVVTDNGTPPRSGSGTISISIAGVNDAPQFSRGADQTVVEDAGEVVVNGWATNILAGPPAALDEHATQTVSFEVTSDAPSLFAVPPTVDGTGTLRFTPAPDANGLTVVTVVAVDDGPGTAPHVNRSAPQSFTISIVPVNDPPVFTAGANVIVDEDSGAYSAAWATGIAAAAGLRNSPPTALDEAGQEIFFTVDVENPAIFSVQPNVTATGELRFTTATNAHGSSVVRVKATDRGPSGGLHQNTSAEQTFTIVIQPVNDPPIAQADAYAIDENSVLSVPAPGLLANDTDVDLPDDALRAVSGTFTSTLGAVVVIQEDGSFTYDPTGVATIQQLTSGQNVIDSFSYVTRDASDAESSPAVVTIQVDGIDDPPIARDDVYSIGVGQTRLLPVLDNDTDIDSSIDPRTIVITTLPLHGTAVVNQTGVIEYTPNPGYRGLDTLGYTVKDAAGNVSNEATVTLAMNTAPVANNDIAFTFKNEPVDVQVLSNDSDVDGTIDPATVQVVVNPTPGGLAEPQPDGTIRYTPPTDFSGTVRFSYVVRDELGTVSNVAQVTVNVQNSRWQNPAGNMDVNDDGFVSPIDALLVINYLNKGNETFLPNIDPPFTPPPYLDVNGDEFVTPLDALLVINFLNSTTAGGEGESPVEASTQTYVTMVTPEQILVTVAEEVLREVQAALNDSLVEVVQADRFGGEEGVLGASSSASDWNWLAGDQEEEESALEALIAERLSPLDDLRDGWDAFFGELE
ncbi:MAG: hypothetical protein KatS3mg111_3522 [Pirellulaceae bacterium]|nr:MAG: hypothetical protein KatS3mg111_3522 [Pirellulaceae bacterium]